MTLRIKFLLVLIFLAAASSVTFGISSYLSTANRLHTEIDRSLDDATDHVLDDLRRGEYPNPSVNGVQTPPPAVSADDLPGTPKRFDEVLVQLLYPDGTIRYQTTTEDAPIRPIERDVAAGRITTPQWGTVTEPGEAPYRVLTTPIPDLGGGAVEVGRSLAETQRVLSALRDRTIIIMLAVTVAAGLVGWLLAMRVTRRIEQLTNAAETVSNSGKLDVQVASSGHDETARLAQAFNRMLATLAESQDAQRRLVQDAGHELRTPLTSVRTNLSMLRRYEQLGPVEHGRVLDDLDSESRELTDLVNKLVELATEARSDEPAVDIPIKPLIERVADRAQRRTGHLVEVRADDTIVHGQPEAIERAVSNLLDNAAKFAGGAAPIEVHATAGRIEVRDRGPGFKPEDIQRVFDRFYRSVEMRSHPGSGLGLAIVRDIALRHGGSVFAANRPGGGAVVGMALPPVSVVSQSVSPSVKTSSKTPVKASVKTSR